jgi:SAM-dependent methyltransferase
MKTLNEIGRLFNTDKAHRWSDYNKRIIPGNDYLGAYEKVFHPMRDSPVCLLEIGIGPAWNGGASLKTWAEYFVHDGARIVGVDTQEFYRDFRWPKCRAIVADAYQPGLLRHLGEELVPDIAIDDASHMWHHQILALTELLPVIRPGGILIIEDIHTSFGGLRDLYGVGSERDVFSVLSGFAAALAGAGAPHPMKAAAPEVPGLTALIESITFIRKSAVIRKRSN